MECEVDGIPVYYEIVGEGIPILMLPPWELDHAEMMLEMERHFTRREGWRRIYLDLPGMGKTPGADWISGNDQVLKVIEDFVDQVIPGQRFIVAGSSYGGRLARGLVYRRWAEIDGVLLNSPSIVPRPAKEHLPQRVVLAPNPAMADQIRALDAGWIAQMAVAYGPTLLEYAQGVRGGPELDEKQVGRLAENSAFSFNIDDLPQPFPAPTLFILGRQDHSVGYHDAWGIIETYPRATFAVLDRAGHLAFLEQPVLCAALVSDWLVLQRRFMDEVGIMPPE